MNVLKTNFTTEAKQTTHSGGRGEPLHDWFPYLEGYSSSFVANIVNHYLPNAKSIMDPFAGVGTTPITLSCIGINCPYSEINPAMRLVIELKSSILSLDFKNREKISKEIFIIKNNLQNKILKYPPDKILHNTYEKSFGKSIFFENENYNLILKLRSFIDEIAMSNNFLSRILEVAVISQLLKCSLLKRAGDIRYKTTKEKKNGIPNILKEIINQLSTMEHDCLTCQQGQGNIELACNNAKNLTNIKSFQVDGIITSPPYLNGTNYFRNTKLELWFIREIIDNYSLRKFRDDAITSGINDVAKEKGKNIHPIIKDLYEKLNKEAYDQRIPKMVAGYFEEMGLVFLGLKKHLKENGLMIIDIGDSIYAGVQVDTHLILSEIAKNYGFELIEIVLLRKRNSRDGRKLSQYLIILKKKD